MIDYIPFKETGYFSEFITDYLSQKAELRCLYHRFPLATNFPAQIKEKQAHYSAENRDILAQALAIQKPLYFQRDLPKHRSLTPRKHLYHYNRSPVKSLYRASVFYL